MLLFLTPARSYALAIIVWAPQPWLLALQLTPKREDIYNILWVLVFGFATLNILGLVARRFEPSARNRLSFGETLAVMVVLVSIVLLGWEMMNVFKIFPLKIRLR